MFRVISLRGHCDQIMFIRKTFLNGFDKVLVFIDQNQTILLNVNQ